DLAPRAAAADAHGARLRVDLDVLEQRQVDDDSAVARPEPGAVVAAAADREREAAVAREADRVSDAGGVFGARDERRPAIDHRVVYGARLLVIGVVGADEAPAEAGHRLA